MGKLFWKIVKWIAGWKIDGFDITSIDKALIAVGPHTSAWDVPIGLFTRGSMGADVRFLAKHTLFKPPFGFIFKWLGGLPVDRTQHTNLVDSVTELYHSNKKLLIAMTPEGTRHKVDRLKTGFYHIARRSNIPIILCKFDFGNKIVTFGSPYHPSENMEAELQKVWDYWKGVKGYHPDLGID